MPSGPLWRWSSKWIETINSKDLAAHMALIDDNVVYRGDPVEHLGHSARGYCSNYSFIWNNTWVRLDELYVVAAAQQPR